MVEGAFSLAWTHELSSFMPSCGALDVRPFSGGVRVDSFQITSRFHPFCIQTREGCGWSLKQDEIKKDGVRLPCSQRISGRSLMHHAVFRHVTVLLEYTRRIRDFNHA